MLTHRCPWCGEKMNLRLPFFVENPIWWRGKDPLLCPACKQRYRSKSNLFKRILTTVAVLQGYSYCCILIGFSGRLKSLRA